MIFRSIGNDGLRHKTGQKVYFKHFSQDVENDNLYIHKIITSLLCSIGNTMKQQ